MTGTGETSISFWWIGVPDGSRFRCHAMSCAAREVSQELFQVSFDTNDLLPGYHLTVCTDLDGQQILDADLCSDDSDLRPHRLFLHSSLKGLWFELEC